jgi:hypothetical protein
MGAIFALGLIGAGTNNSRIAQMLRGLASYYHKEPNNLFIVRIAQVLFCSGCLVVFCLVLVLSFLDILLDSNTYLLLRVFCTWARAPSQ